jgi:hypothetical protein
LMLPAGSIRTTTLLMHQLRTGFCGCTSFRDTISRSISQPGRLHHQFAFFPALDRVH